MTSTQPDILAGLEPDDADRVMALGALLLVPAGETLFQLGDFADRMFAVVRGRIALSLPMQIHGALEHVLVEEKLPGQMFGWSGLIPPHRFTLKATAPVESELLALPRAALFQYFEAHPAVGLVVTRNVASVIGRRLGVFQTMWIREMQRAVDVRHG